MLKKKYVVGVILATVLVLFIFGVISLFISQKKDQKSSKPTIVNNKKPSPVNTSPELVHYVNKDFGFAFSYPRDFGKIASEDYFTKTYTHKAFFFFTNEQDVYDSPYVVIPTMKIWVSKKGDSLPPEIIDEFEYPEQHRVIWEEERAIVAGQQMECSSSLVDVTAAGERCRIIRLGSNTPIERYLAFPVLGDEGYAKVYTLYNNPYRYDFIYIVQAGAVGDDGYKKALLDVLTSKISAADFPDRSVQVHLFSVIKQLDIFDSIVSSVNFI